MTEKELKRLSRAELLELLLIQTRETEKLRSQLARAAKLLNDRRIAIEKSGDLAQAVLSVNSVIDAATTAANQYLYNIEIMEQETKERCRKMLAEAQAEAARIRGGAQQELVTTPETPAYQCFYSLPETVSPGQSLIPPNSTMFV